MKTRLQKHDLLLYFLLTYTITWGGCLIVAAKMGFDIHAIGLAEIGLMILFMLAGPSTSSLILTVYFEGRSGLAKLFGRLKDWHFRAQWTAVAILTVPILSTFTLLILSILVSPIYRPEVTLGKLGFGLAAGLLAGFFEEIGWTGFALPRLMSRFNFLASGIILGVLWAIWHGMADFWGNNATFGLYWLPTFIIYWLMPLTAYRILMVWVYKNNPSLPLMQIMHAFYSGTLGVLEPSLTPSEGLVWKALFTALLWIVVTIVIIRYGKEKTQIASLA